MNIELPKLFAYEEGRDFTTKLAALNNEPELTLDFSKLYFASPLGSLLIGREIRHLAQRRKINGLTTNAIGLKGEVSAHTYLEHIGFFDYVGIKGHGQMGHAKGSSNYIPVRKISRSDLVGKDPGNSKFFKQNVLRYAEEIGGVLLTHADTEGYRAICYAFKEIIRNVFEHSGAEDCYIAGQRWKTGVVEVAIIDEGMGIRRSLSQAIDCPTDLEALEAAIRPGVSRAMKLTEAENIYDNSGFGLYVLSELGRCFGRFAIGSGTSALTRATYGAAADSVSFHGTYVGLRLTQYPHSFSGVLDDIVAEGERAAEAAGLSGRASRDSKSSSVPPPAENENDVPTS